MGGRYHLVFVALVCSLSVAALSSSCGKNRSLSKDDLKIAAGQLRTFAAASQFLVDVSAADGTPQTFFLSQTEMLTEKVRTTSGSLEGSAGEFESDRRQAVRIADDINNALSRMGSQAFEPEHADFNSLRREAKSLEDKLAE